MQMLKPRKFNMFWSYSENDLNTTLNLIIPWNNRFVKDFFIILWKKEYWLEVIEELVQLSSKEADL